VSTKSGQDQFTLPITLAMLTVRETRVRARIVHLDV
jgi:hypothetical protein